MADKNDSTPARDVDALVKGLRAAGNESMRLARATAKLEKSFEEASNAAIDKAAEALTELAKQSGILEDALKAEIAAHKQSPRELAKVMDRLESQGDALIKEQRRYAEQLRGIQAERKKLEKLDQKDAAVQKQLKAVIAKELDLKLDLNDRLKELIPNVKDAADKLDQLAAEAHRNKDAIGKLAQDLQKPSAKFGKALDGMHSKVQTSISGLGEFATVVALAKKAVGELWGQSIRLANKGLVGSMAQMNISALKLKMTAEEFEGLVSANRDMIAVMGGGAEGIANFEAVLSESSVGLEYLGKEGKKAAATIMAGFNRAGFGLMSTNRDVADSYQQNMRGLNKQFKLFNGIFGDTAEEFANLYEQQLKSESLQAKLLSGDTRAVALQMKEIMARTENLKLMGLNNDQIIAMSKRAEELFNPTENRQGEAQTERIAARQAMMLGAQTVRSVDADLAKRIQGYVESGETARVQNMSPQDRASYAAQNPQYAKDIALLDQTIANMRAQSGGDVSQIGNAYVHTRKMAGKEYGFEANTGKDLLSARARGYDQTAEGMSALAAKGFQNTLSDVNGETTKLGRAFGNLRDAVEGVTSIFNNPFTSALSAAGAALLFSSSTVKGAILKAADSIMGVGKMMFSSLGGFMKGLFAIAKKIPILSAIFGGIEGAYEAFQTDTDEYYKRSGIERDATVVPQFLKDVGVRVIGVLSDVGRATVRAGTFGALDIAPGFSRGSTPAASTLPNAAKQVSAQEALKANPNLAKYLDGVAKLETQGGLKTIKGQGGADSNNLYNIKDFSGGGYRAYDKAEGSRDAYRVYGSKEESTADMISLLQRKYPGALTARTPEEFAMALKAGGYATDPAYVSKLANVIRSQSGTGVASQMAAAPPASQLALPTASAAIVAPGAAQQMSTARTMPAPPSQPPAAASAASSAAGPSNGNPVVSELQKHTSLLSTMINLLGKVPASAKGYQMDVERGVNVSG